MRSTASVFIMTVVVVVVAAGACGGASAPPACEATDGDRSVVWGAVVDAETLTGESTVERARLQLRRGGGLRRRSMRRPLLARLRRGSQTHQPRVGGGSRRAVVDLVRRTAHGAIAP